MIKNFFKQIEAKAPLKGAFRLFSGHFPAVFITAGTSSSILESQSMECKALYIKMVTNVNNLYTFLSKFVQYFTNFFAVQML